MYVCTYVRTCIHAYMHTCTHAYMHTYMPAYIHTYVRTFVPTYLRTYVPTYLRTYGPTDVRTYVRRSVRPSIHPYSAHKFHGRISCPILMKSSLHPSIIIYPDGFFPWSPHDEELKALAESSETNVALLGFSVGGWLVASFQETSRNDHYDILIYHFLLYYYIICYYIILYYYALWLVLLFHSYPKDFNYLHFHYQFYVDLDQRSKSASW
jgi:hypothetical protein